MMEMLRHPSQLGQQTPPRRSNAGVAVAVIGGLAAVGGIAAAAFASSRKPAKLGYVKPTIKPCKCGR